MVGATLLRLAGEPVLVLGLTLILAWPLGVWLARTWEPDRPLPVPLLPALEARLYRLAGIRPGDSMTWRSWAVAFLAFHALGFALLLLILLLQGHLPWNPDTRSGLGLLLAVDTATSFVTNTNWQACSGEAALGPFAQAIGLAPQNFLSAAAGMAVLAALSRGLAGRRATGLGNFWVDLTRGILYVLLPLSLLVALLLLTQGVVQTLATSFEVKTLEGGWRQILAVGPVASQVAIKQLGTNGGGYFGANSAHPFENPTALSNLVEAVSILVLPAACCFAFGRAVGDRRQGRLLLAVMLALLLPLLVLAIGMEQAGNPLLPASVVDQAASALQAGGNMEGKEVRFGPVSSATWAALTTAASNGSVNAMHDSFTPLGGLVPMVLMQMGEVVFGGVGSGLYGMVLFALVAVFAAGLMVGRPADPAGLHRRCGERPRGRPGPRPHPARRARHHGPRRGPPPRPPRPQPPRHDPPGVGSPPPGPAGPAAGGGGGVGPGFPDGQEESIFQRFQRGTHRADGGVGLGLAICRAAVAAHGGSIVAHRGEGGGARFHLVLPASGERWQPPDEPLHPETP